VPIAAADDPQHAEVRLAVAAGTDAEHAGDNNTGVPGGWRVGGGASRIMSD
jgi:hypothetical protein